MTLKENNKFIYWTPRILSIIFIIFLALFSLDVFDGNIDFWQILVALLMHNIPSFVLLIILLISWKYEIVGGIAYILAGLLYIVLLFVRILNSDVREWYMLAWAVQIAGPAFFIGILFLMGWFKKKKHE